MNKFLSPATTQIILAVAALLIGVVVYLLDRQPERIYFIPQWLANSIKGGSFSGPLGSYLPTFVHVYAFILLTMAIVVPGGQYRRYLLLVCIFWFALDSVFEIAQLESVAHIIASHTPNWFTGIPFLENTADYFLAGTFDALDLVSIGIGSMGAYYTVAIIQNYFTVNEQEEENQEVTP